MKIIKEREYDSSEIDKEEIISYFDTTVTKLGTGAHAIVPKAHLNKKVIVLVKSDKKC